MKGGKTAYSPKNMPVPECFEEQDFNDPLVCCCSIPGWSEGHQSTTNQMIPFPLQIAFAKTARQRAWLDLQLHFNKKMLNSVVRSPLKIT